MAFSMDCDVLIIGGGVAGLAAAIRLRELGREVLLIEAGTYPSHKVCGEFLSPEALPILESWGLTPHTIDRLTIHSGKQSLALQAKAGSCSRYHLEQFLVDKAIELGVELRTSTRVTDLNAPTANIRIIGAGRLIHATSKPQYVGYKAHFLGIATESELHMHLLPGAYYGISPIGDGIANVACLAKIGSVDPDHLKSLVGGEMVFSDWLTAKVPHFGLKTLPKWPNTYFVGDAAATIPPASGDGIAIGLTSGVMCADYAARGAWKQFQQNWKRRYASRILWAKALHQLMLHPKIAWMGALCPKLLFRKTRES